ncbi:M48 family metalloprotease [Burkholderia vietnamiensis]|uniref:hypothetical protein n=1 Tax=Burkholderia vietnamiensis TaxID=60552 RepID=UPI001CF4A1C7|nr:hypothetical protein [Burkholderia vietnamiensis]MCA8228297.1 hypothetical protein [Burkholderia vietnamiensis]
MKTFSEDAQKVFDRFAERLSRINLTRAVALPIALSAVVALGAVSVPAHAQTSLAASAVAVTVSGSQAKQPPSLNSTILSVMTDETRREWARAYADQSAQRSALGSDLTQVDPTDTSFLRVTDVMNRLQGVGGAKGVQITVFDNPDSKITALGAGNRVLIQKAVVNSLSDDALAFVLSHEIERVAEGRTVARYEQMLQIASADARAGRNVPDLTGFSALDSSYGAAVAPKTRGAELELDAIASRIADQAGYDGVSGAKESFAKFGVNDVFAPSSQLRAAEIDAQRKHFAADTPSPALGS